MSLSPAQRREYRAIAHHLKPVVTLGDKGMSEGVREEVERALNDHELIKVKVVGGEKAVREAQANALCEATGAELVQLIGRMAVILRRSAQPNRKLSNLARSVG